jgi:hypothetical protein
LITFQDITPSPHRLSVPTHPHSRPILSDALTGAQDLLGHPTGRSRHDCPETLLVCRLQQPHLPAFKPAAWLNRAQGFTGSD